MHLAEVAQSAMRRPIRIAIPLAIFASVAAAAAAAAAVIPVYGNEMSSVGARSQLVKLGKGRCHRGGRKALSVAVGKRTRECKLATPVIGSNLDIRVKTRLSKRTPRALQKKVFVGIAVRDGDGGQYQLAVYPRRGTYQLRRDLPPDGARTLLAKGKSKVIKGVGKANKLRLQAFPRPDGGLGVVAIVNGRKLAAQVEDAHTASTLGGRSSSLSVGAAKAAKGAHASFDHLRVAVPDPF